MSEPKLCPFRKRVHSMKDYPDLEEGFAPCLEEKCAMWRELLELAPSLGATRSAGTWGPEVVSQTWIGYCGLAGKPHENERS